MITARPPKIKVGGTLDPSTDLYVIRQDVEERVFDYLSSGEYCNILSSRQVGKSSLVINTKNRLIENEFRAAIVDFTQLGGTDDARSWYIAFLRTVARALKLDLDVREWSDVQREEPLNECLLRFFREEVFQVDSSPVVIFCDEIDSTLKLDFTDDFFTAVRAMYNARSDELLYHKVVFCMIGVAAPNELVKDPRTTPYNIGEAIELRDFDRERGDDLSGLALALSNDPQIGQAILLSILDWTDGHPYLTLKLVKELREQNVQTPQEVDEFCQQTFSNLETVNKDVHFQAITRFFTQRAPSDPALFKLYEQLLKGKAITDAPSPLHINLKLSGLVKRKANRLIVRNRIYQQTFDLEWVKDSKPVQTVRNLQHLAMVTMILLLMLSGWYAYDRLILQPPRQFATQLEQELAETLDVIRAKEIFKLLAGLEIDPEFGQRLQGYQAAANAGMDRFWQRKEKVVAETRLAELGRTSNENDARRFFSILTGQTVDPEIDRVLKGWQEQALTVYQDFWQRRANSLDTRALQRLKDGDSDRALLLGAAAAVKRNGQLHPKLLETYQERGYARLYRTIRGNFSGWSRIDFSPDSKLIAVSTANGVYETDTGKNIQKMEIEKRAVSVRFSENGNYFASGDNDGRVKLWELGPRKKTIEFKGFDSFIQDIDFSKNDRYLAATAQSKSAIVWDMITTDILYKPQLPGGDGRAIRFSPEGKQLAVGYFNGAILFNVISRKKVYDFNFDKPRLVSGIDFSPDGKKIAMATWRGYGVLIWDVEKNIQILHLPYVSDLYGIAFSPDGQYVFAGGDITGRNVTARLWDATSGEVLYEVTGHTSNLRDVAYAANGKWVATVSQNGSIRIWDITDLEGAGLPSTPEGTPREIWDRFQLMFRYTLNDQDEVIDLWPTGPRHIDGWENSPKKES